MVEVVNGRFSPVELFPHGLQGALKVFPPAREETIINVGSGQATEAVLGVPQQEESLLQLTLDPAALQ